MREIVQNRFPSLIVKEVMCHENCLVEMGDFKPDVLIFGATGRNQKDMEDLQKIRGSFPATVIVLFTAYENEEYRKEGIMKGANHIISKELWTGNEILALIKTILATKESWDKEYAEDTLNEEEFLHRPVERRRIDRRGRAREREYLNHHPDRRGWN